MVRFKVYYDGGKEFDSAKEGPMPGRGVQAVVQDHPEVTSEIVTACDYFVWRIRREHKEKYQQLVREIHQWGRWFGVDRHGLWDWMVDCGLVLEGRMIERQEYMDICNKALKDKAGWLPHEVRLT